MNLFFTVGITILLSLWCLRRYSSRLVYLNLVYKSKITSMTHPFQHIYVDVEDQFYEEVPEFDVSIVSQTSKERLFYFNYLIKRWNGPFCIGFAYDDSLDDKIDEILSPDYVSPRVHLIPYHMNDTNTYPINLLRNLAINAVTTSHFWLTDMDMWPAVNLYEVLHRLPTEIQQHKYFAMIVPAFEYIKRPDCRTLEDCVKIFAEHFPKTKDELIDCVQTENCAPFRERAKTHSYLFPGWYKHVENMPYTLVECFPNKLQEPYIVLKKTPELPLFDPRFVNYGFNKIQWIEELRYKGYLFGVLSDAFAIDVPHERSRFAIDYIDQWKDKNKVVMKNLYDSFMEHLTTTVEDRSIVYLCEDAMKPIKSNQGQHVPNVDSTKIINQSKRVLPRDKHIRYVRIVNEKESPQAEVHEPPKEEPVAKQDNSKVITHSTTFDEDKKTVEITQPNSSTSASDSSELSTHLSASKRAINKRLDAVKKLYEQKKQRAQREKKIKQILRRQHKGSS